MSVESIHPTAIIDPSASLGAGVRVGAGAIIGPGCTVGDGSKIRERAILVERVSMGRGNDVHPYAVLGGDPQDRSFDYEKDPGSLVIGDDNIFREHVTISRGAGDAGPTTIGDRTFFMACSHAGHNVHVADDVILANAVLLGGHVRVGRGAFLGGNTLVHQFCFVGERVMSRGDARIAVHVPPFVMVSHDADVIGLNKVGLRRCGEFTRAELEDLKRVFADLQRHEGPNILQFLDDLLDSSESRAAQQYLETFREWMEAPAPFNRSVARRNRRYMTRI